MTYSDVDHYHISEFPKSDFRTSLQNVWSLTIIMNRLGHSSPDRSPPPQTCRQIMRDSPRCHTSTNAASSR
jgi:hypothetical protein